MTGTVTKPKPSENFAEYLKNKQIVGSNAAKVVNGELAQEGEYPYAVSLVFRRIDHFCGGTLITPQLVLSAAHCVFDFFAVFDGEIDAILGCNDITLRGNCEVIKVRSVRIHPGFNSQTSVLGGNDLAIYFLGEPSTQPLAKLPTPLVGQNAFTGLLSFEVGWGNEDPTSGNFVGGQELKEADSLVLDNGVCGAQNDILFDLVFGLTDTIDNSMICTTAESKGVCQGDSGGPLVLKCDGEEQDLVIGATSFGLGCAMRSIPSVFARTFTQGAFDFINASAHSRGEEEFLQFVDNLDDYCPEAPLRPDPNVVPTKFPTINAAAWTCDPEFFATQDGCDCNCGIRDPDCEFDDELIFNCSSPLQFCNDQGRCVYENPGLVFVLPSFLGCFCICLFLLYCRCKSKRAKQKEKNRYIVAKY